MMKKIIIFLIILNTSNIIGQEFTCDDFKTGIFIGTTPMFQGVEWKIIRKNSSQIESISKIPQKYLDMGFPTDILYSKIEQIDDCVFNFKYDETKMTLDENQKSLNDTGGLMVEISKIEGKCFYYISKSIFQDKEMIIEGKLCKE